MKQSKRFYFVCLSGIMPLAWYFFLKPVGEEFNSAMCGAETKASYILMKHRNTMGAEWYMVQGRFQQFLAETRSRYCLLDITDNDLNVIKM